MPQRRDCAVVAEMREDIFQSRASNLVHVCKKSTGISTHHTHLPAEIMSGKSPADITETVVLRFLTTDTCGYLQLANKSQSTEPGPQNVINCH